MTRKSPFANVFAVLLHISPSEPCNSSFGRFSVPNAVISTPAPLARALTSTVRGDVPLTGGRLDGYLPRCVLWVGVQTVLTVAQCRRGLSRAQAGLRLVPFNTAGRLTVGVRLWLCVCVFAVLARNTY